MNIIYFTKGIRGSICLEHVLENGFQIGAVIAVVPENEIQILSERFKFPVVFLEKINSPESVAQLKQLGGDLFVLCGYNKIIKNQVIDIPSLGTINLHGGKLPEYRGAAPINWQIINGEKTGGCSIIYVDEGIDTGDIIAQEIYPISSEDTHASILEKTLQIFPRLLIDVLRQVEDGTVNAIPQDPRTGGYFGRRYPHDSLIHWESMTDLEVHNLVRGMHGPYPSAYSFKDGEKIEFEKTAVLVDTVSGSPGIVVQIRGREVIVMARNRGLLIKEILVNGERYDPAAILKVGDDLNNHNQEDGSNE